VEARGIEPLSENSSIQISTGVYCLLRIPRTAAGSQAEVSGSPEYIQRGGTSLRERSPLIDAWIPNRGTFRSDGGWL